MVGLSSEVELKFQISSDEAATVAAHSIFAHKATAVQLQSVYYDTSDWKLRRAGISLRIRLKGGVFTQTVKRQGALGVFERDEWEAEIGSAMPDPSEWAGTPIDSVLSAKRIRTLASIFTTNIRRTVCLVREKKSLVEVSLDRGELVAGELREPIEEVELELKHGNVACLFGLARRLAARTPLRLSLESKAERGYRLIGGDALAPYKAQPAKIPKDMSAAQAFTQVVRSCIAQVTANALLLHQVRNPEVLHQLRIGLRRLRAAAAAFETMLARKTLDRLKNDSNWISVILDPARDLDVFIEKVLPLANQSARDKRALRTFGDRLQQARASAYDRAVASVDSKRFANFVLNCAEWETNALSRHNSRRTLASLRDDGASTLATQALNRFYRQLRKRCKHLKTLDPVKRHEARIKAKKLRYAAEFFAGTFGKGTKKPRKRFIGALDALQSALGDLNDLMMARKTALAVVGRSTSLAFHAGHLVGKQDRDEPELLAKAVHVYDRWQRVKPFWL